MPTMGAGEAVTFGEGVALPTRMNFDLLPAHCLPKSTTASFTQNWTKETADEKFLHDIVSRWRQQTYNPLAESTAQEVSEEPTPQPAGFNQQGDPRLKTSLPRPVVRTPGRRATDLAPGAADNSGWPQDVRGLHTQAAALRPPNGGNGTGRVWGQMPATPAAPPAPAETREQPKGGIASLLKQYRGQP
jgi:hypothetical protein